jgi:Xaa-Pro aminopeptidase
MVLDSLRRSRLIEGLSAAKLDACVCSAASDVLLLTGYWPVMAMSIAFLAADGECHVLLPQDEEELAIKTSSAEVTTYEPGSLEKLTDLMTSLEAPLTRMIQKCGLEQARIGIRQELTEQPSSYVVSANFHDSLSIMLKRTSPSASLQSCDHLLETQKASKTPLELERLDRAVDIVATGFAAAQSAIQPGLRETDVAARIQFAFDSAPEAEEVQRSYGSFYCMSGPNSAKADAAYARTRQRRLEEGDLVMIHANTCADGFWTDVTRTYTTGIPSDRQQSIRSAIMEARKAGLDAIHPGATGSAVDGAARSVLKSHGLGEAFKHGAGHGVGFAAANAAGRPRIHPLSPDILEPGMTFNLEPAVYFDGYGGMRHCDLVAVTADGARVLTNF